MVAAVVARAGARCSSRGAREGGLFGGLWEPPMVEAPSLAAAQAALEGAGIAGSARLVEVGEVRHVLTHREMTGDRGARGGPPAVAAEAPTTAPYERAAWQSPASDGIGISSLAKRILRAAR